MKKFLHIFVPLIMACAIIFSIGWYLIEYDPEFTRDFLLQQARFFDERSNHTVAVWFYNLAYRQSDNDDNVAIELAQQYKAIGNYTKAESTLSSAIADGGSTSLYVALCQTYVEQNKLIDAVTMLNNIADPGMKAQLDAMRPAAPAATPEAGNYSEYISVTLTSENGTIYYSTDGIYPSLENDQYNGAFTLSGGETTVLALCIGENGLVSPLATYTYTIRGVIEAVTFADPVVEQAIREVLDATPDQVLYSNELWAITELTIPAEATNCDDLKWLPYLKTLTVSGSVFSDLSPIAQLTDICELSITDSVVSQNDLLLIASLPNLDRLTLVNCQLSIIANLAGAKNLTYLDLSENSIHELRPLAGMQSLEYLYLKSNAVTSAAAISGLSALKVLDLSYNSLLNTDSLAPLIGLEELDVSFNSLTSLSGIEKLTNLTVLTATNNNLVDIRMLESCAKLEELNVSYNTLLSIDVVATLPALRTLNFANNEVSSLPTFQTGCSLWTIDGSNNLLTDLSGLSNLHTLSYVYMDNNRGISSVACLKNCYLLLKVSVCGTKVSDVSMLTEHDNIIVYYDYI